MDVVMKKTGLELQKNFLFGAFSSSSSLGPGMSPCLAGAEEE
jgi:hypothetical protein